MCMFRTYSRVYTPTPLEGHAGNDNGLYMIRDEWENGTFAFLPFYVLMSTDWLNGLAI